MEFDIETLVRNTDHIFYVLMAILGCQMIIVIFNVVKIILKVQIKALLDDIKKQLKESTENNKKDTSEEG